MKRKMSTCDNISSSKRLETDNGSVIIIEQDQKPGDSIETALANANDRMVANKAMITRLDGIMQLVYVKRDKCYTRITELFGKLMQQLRNLQDSTLADLNVAVHNKQVAISELCSELRGNNQQLQTIIKTVENMVKDGSDKELLSRSCTPLFQMAGLASSEMPDFTGLNTLEFRQKEKLNSLISKDNVGYLRQHTILPEELELIGPQTVVTGKIMTISVEAKTDYVPKTYDYLQLTVTKPDGKKKKYELMDNHNRVYTMAMIPDDVGNYSVSVKIYDHHIINSPLCIEVTAPDSKVKDGGTLVDRSSSILMEYEESNLCPMSSSKKSAPIVKELHASSPFRSSWSPVKAPGPITMAPPPGFHCFPLRNNDECIITRDLCNRDEYKFTHDLHSNDECMITHDLRRTAQPEFKLLPPSEFASTKDGAHSGINSAIVKSEHTQISGDTCRLKRKPRKFAMLENLLQNNYMYNQRVNNTKSQSKVSSAMSQPVELNDLAVKSPGKIHSAELSDISSAEQASGNSCRNSKPNREDAYSVVESSQVSLESGNCMTDKFISTTVKPESSAELTLDIESSAVAMPAADKKQSLNTITSHSFSKQRKPEVWASGLNSSSMVTKSTVPCSASDIIIEEESWIDEELDVSGIKTSPQHWDTTTKAAAIGKAYFQNIAPYKENVQKSTVIASSSSYSKPKEHTFEEESWTVEELDKPKVSEFKEESQLSTLIATSPRTPKKFPPPSSFGNSSPKTNLLKDKYMLTANSRKELLKAASIPFSIEEESWSDEESNHSEPKSKPFLPVNFEPALNKNESMSPTAKLISNLFQQGVASKAAGFTGTRNLNAEEKPSIDLVNMFYSQGLSAQLEMKFGEFCPKDKESTDYNFTFPIGISATTDKIIVCDTGKNTVKVYDNNGKFLFKFNDSVMSSPSAVVVIPSGNIAVKDNHRIYIFDSSGHLLHKFGEGLLGKPYGLVLTKLGHLVCYDDNRYSGHLLHFFSLDGSHVKTMPLSFQEELSFGSKIRFMATHNDKIIIADLGLSYIYITDLEGRLIKRFGGKSGVSKSTGGLFCEPSGISVDGVGNMFISDSRNQRIQLFNADGNFEDVLRLDTRLTRVSDIHLTSDNRLLVLDFTGHRVLVFKLVQGQNIPKR